MIAKDVPVFNKYSGFLSSQIYDKRYDFDIEILPFLEDYWSVKSCDLQSHVTYYTVIIV